VVSSGRHAGACRDWFQLSLKEGLTVYRDQEFSADQGSRAVKRIMDVRTLRAAQFREDASPLAHPVQPQSYLAIDNFYTATVYNKGAEVIRMMATIIGRAAFRRGMDLYFQRHDNQAVTIDDFVQAMQDASGVNLQDFKQWYHQAGTPKLAVTGTYDPAARRYTLTIEQSRKVPGRESAGAIPLVIPVAMGLLDEQGRALPARLTGENESHAGTRVLLAREAETRFVFEDVASRPVASLLRGFSAPVKLSGVADDDLRVLAAHDTDPFVRWESGQQLACGILLRMVERTCAGERAAVPADLAEIAEALLARAEEDPAFTAEALALPSETFLADQMETAEIDAIHAAREMARAAIGRTLQNRFRATYQRLTDPGPYAIDGAAMGRRALRNLCLAYLAAADEAEGVALAKAQFDAGQNMTDALAALSVLSHIDCPERKQALAAFYAAWRGDDLVLDKWFAIQAISKLPGTLEAIHQLTHHPDFDLKNPNRVRALTASFAGGNPVRFHERSGAGYRFLVDMILSLDPMNAQVAARMISPLGQWRRLDAGRQEKMKNELQRILDTPRLSANSREMASRSLQA
jgi:aminopeptidase N